MRLMSWPHTLSLERCNPSLNQRGTSVVFSLFGNSKKSVSLSIENDVLGTIDRLRLQLAAGFDDQAVEQFIGQAALEGAMYLEPFMEAAAPVGSAADGDPHPGRLANSIVSRVGKYKKPSAIVGIYPGRNRRDMSGAYYGRAVVSGTGTTWSRRGAIQERADLRRKWKAQDKAQGISYGVARKQRAAVYNRRLEALGLLQTYERTALPSRPFVRETAKEYRSEVADVVRGTLTALINDEAARAIVGAVPLTAKGDKKLIRSQAAYAKRVGIAG